MGTTGFDGFNQADMVIEAVLEDVALKQRIFRELEEHCPPHCILATNTSTINIDIVGQRTRQVRIHMFFSRFCYLNTCVC